MVYSESCNFTFQIKGEKDDGETLSYESYNWRELMDTSVYSKQIHCPNSKGRPDVFINIEGTRICPSLIWRIFRSKVYEIQKLANFAEIEKSRQIGQINKVFKLKLLIYWDLFAQKSVKKKSQFDEKNQNF